MRLTQNQWSMIQLALRVAAEVFERDAETVGNVRLKHQFEKQRDEARALLEVIEDHLPDGQTMTAMWIGGD